MTNVNGWVARWSVACAALGLSACAAEVVGAPIDEVAAARGIEVIDAETFAAMPEGVDVWLDLRDQTAGYTVDTDAVPLERIALVCPNGQVMGWDEWVAADPALAEHAEGVIGIALHPSIAEMAVPTSGGTRCPLDCYTCRDGATLCHPDWECLGEQAPGSGGSSVSVESELWRELWRDGPRSGPVPPPPGSGGDGGGEGAGGGGVPDPSPQPSSGGSRGSGSSGSGGYGGSSGSSGSGGSSPGGHPGWG